MRTFASLVLSASISLLATTSAFAEEWTGTAYGKAATGYVYGDFDLVATYEPVAQGGVTLSRGPWAFDGWVSYGPQGGLAQEFDASVFHTTTRGCLRTQYAVQYFAVNIDESLGDSRDDIVILYGDFSCVLKFGNLTVAPLIRPIQAVGLNDIQSQTLMQGGVRLDYRVTEVMSVNLDVRDSVNLTADHEAVRYQAGVSWQATDQTSVQFGVNGTENSRAVFSVGFATAF